MSIKTNTTSLQDLLEQVNALPDAGGVDLPELTNEGTAADLLSGKELIDSEGNKVTGTFTLDSELTTQDDLIAQIQAAVDSLPEAGGSSGGSASYDTCTLEINNQNNVQYILAYTSIENGEIVAKYIKLTSPTSITCLCGSILCCYVPGSLISTSLIKLGNIDGDYYYSNAYRVDASANEIITATVTFGGGGGAN